MCYNLERRDSSPDGNAGEFPDSVHCASCSDCRGSQGQAHVHRPVGTYFPCRGRKIVNGKDMKKNVHENEQNVHENKSGSTVYMKTNVCVRPVPHWIDFGIEVQKTTFITVTINEMLCEKKKKPEELCPVVMLDLDGSCK